ncbi:MAG TPA: hypothetical protein VHG10_04130 [Glycomyces sp.]|nr:hypothetical protein [Glycomyces sp.]
MSAPRPGAAIAAAVEGARAARKAIAARSTRSSVDLAAAVRDSVTRFSATDSSVAHLRARPRQDHPRPVPWTAPHRSIRPAPGSYMAAWEEAFDTGGTFILGTGRKFGAAA